MSEANDNISAVSLFPWLVPCAIMIPPPPPTMRDIAGKVAEKYGLAVDDLRVGWVSVHHITRPRQEAMWHIRQVRLPNGDYRYSSPQVARFFRLTDHTTVLRGVAAHERRMAQRAAA